MPRGRLEPAVDRRRDFVPPVRRHEQVRSVFELEVLRLGGRALVFSYCFRESEAGTVLSSLRSTMSSGARSAFLKCTSVGGFRWKFANPAS